MSSHMSQSVTGDQLVQRLEALPPSEKEKEKEKEKERDYVYVRNDMETPRTPDSYNELPSTTWEPTLSISTAERWEKELLQDPKVSLILPGHVLALSILALSLLIMEYRIASLSPPSLAQTPSKC